MFPLSDDLRDWREALAKFHMTARTVGRTAHYWVRHQGLEFGVPGALQDLLVGLLVVMWLFYIVRTMSGLPRTLVVALVSGFAFEFLLPDTWR